MLNQFGIRHFCKLEPRALYQVSLAIPEHFFHGMVVHMSYSGCHFHRGVRLHCGGVLGLRQCLGERCVRWHLHDVRTQDFPAEHCTVTRISLITSHVSGFNVAADRCITPSVNNTPLKCIY